MSLLGVFYKQPVEVEYYSILYSKDLSTTDELQTAWQMISSDIADPWDGITMSTAYAVLLTDVERLLVSTAGMTFPISPPEGFRFYVANASQETGITVGTFPIPARGAGVFTFKNGVWVEEAKTEAILVGVLNDQRVRTRLFSGLPGEVYKIQVTVTTAEGRTLQDEFTVTIEEN